MVIGISIFILIKLSASLIYVCGIIGDEFEIRMYYFMIDIEYNK